MRIKTRARFNAMAAIVLSIITGLGILMAVRLLGEAQRKDKTAVELIKGVAELRILTDEYLLYRGKRTQMQWQLKYDSLSKLLTAGKLMNLEQEILIDEIVHDLTRVKAVFGELVAGYENGTTGQELEDRLVNLLLSSSQVMVSAAFQLHHASEEDCVTIRQRTVWLIGGLLVFSIMLTASTLLWVNRIIIIPITRLHEGTKVLGRGNLDYRVGTIAKDEIGELSRAFDQMTEKLKTTMVSREILAEEIAQRKRVEQRQRQAEAEMRKLSHAVEQSPSAVIITDPEGSIEYVNPRFTKMSCYGAAEVMGKQSDMLGSEEFSPDAHREMLEKVRAGREWRGEFHKKKKNGELYWVSSSVSAIRDSEGKISHYLAVQEDITEKKLLEKQLIQAQKMEAVGTLAGGVAHDFNNLLSVIIGYSDYLLTKLDREDQMGRLIGEDIELITDLEPKLWLVKADQGQITQILMNFSVNARDAMAGGGKIVIKTENVNIDEEFCRRYSYARPGRFVRLSVEDTGVGMDQETLSHIFEPFFTTKETGKGTGLGLSVIYGIVKQHEGWVNVYSEPGQGSVFKVYLPASFTSEAKEAEGEVSLEELQGHGEGVLLVEDEQMLREFAARTLPENGYVVFAAETAEEALELFERERNEFHIVFSDVVLPDINGVMDDKSQWSVIRKRGFNFLQKPYTLAELLKSMKEAL